MDIIDLVRKPLYVKAVRVNWENMNEVAKWCGGEIRTSGTTTSYILVEVPTALKQRQREAYLGDWVLQMPVGFKIYTDRSLHKAFNLQPKRRKDTPAVVFNLDDSNRQGLPYPEDKIA